MSRVEVFTPEWTERLAGELNSDARFRRTAADWTGVLGLAIELPGGGGRVSILDISSGRCVAAGCDPEALAPDYVISATTLLWKSVLEGKLDPMWGLMSGKLRLAKGSMVELASRGASALRIVECARKIRYTFPGDPPSPASPASDTASPRETQ